MHSHNCLMKSGSSLTEGAELWRKQSQSKDIDLARTLEELSGVRTEFRRKAGTCDNSIVY